MVELRVLSGNHCSLKAPCIINSQNFWNGYKWWAAVFHKLHSK